MSNIDDARLLALRQAPPEDFAKRLRTSLLHEETQAPRPAAWRLDRIAVSISIVAVGIGLLTVPAVRTHAQSFLALFRVVSFVAVPVDVNQAQKLKQLDLPELIGDRVRVIQDPGSPSDVASIEEAAALSGMSIQMPEWLPEGAKIEQIAVTGAAYVQVTADTVRLQHLMDALGITDIAPPAGLDGQVVHVHVPPIVMVRFEHGGRHTRLFQARSPEVTMPDGVGPAALGEIGLRILGLPAAEAKKFANAVDWNSTLLLPVPPTARSIKQVEVSGHTGLAIQFEPKGESPTAMVLWSNGDRVFGLVSIQSVVDVLQMANTVR